MRQQISDFFLQRENIVNNPIPFFGGGLRCDLSHSS